MDSLHLALPNSVTAECCPVKQQKKIVQQLQNLEDIILLFLYGICRDTVRLFIAIIILKSDTSHRDFIHAYDVDFPNLQTALSKTRTSIDLEELESHLSRAVSKIAIVCRFATLRFGFIISLKKSRYYKENCPVSNDKAEVCMTVSLQESSHKECHRNSISVFSALMTVLLIVAQNTSSEISNRIQLQAVSQLEIILFSSHIVYTSFEFDPSTKNLDIYGIHYAIIKRKSARLKNSVYSIHVDTSRNESRNSSFCGRLSSRNVSLSNCTDTDSFSLQYSVTESTFLNYLVTACTVIIHLCIWTPAYIETAPIVQKTVQKKDASLRLARSSLRSFAVDLHGSPNTGYCAMMSFGRTSVQEFCVLVDTGSANLAVAAANFPGVQDYFNVQIADSSLVTTNRQVSVSYTGGDWSGTLVRDTASIGGSPQVEVEFGLITSSNDFFIQGAPWEGILGLAYDSLAKPDSSVKTFWSVLQKFSGLRDMFTISLCPHIEFVNQGGVMEFGDISDTLYTGPIMYTSIMREHYYGVLVTNLTVGDIPIDLPCREFNNDKAIVDSGTTDIFLPVKTFEAIVAAFSKYIQENVPLTVPDSFWRGGSKLAWPSEERSLLFDSFPTFYIGFAQDNNSSSEFSLAVTPQIYLRQVTGSQEEKVEANCLPLCDFFVFGIKSRERGMVIGGNVMLGFATVFDREQKKIGFAKSTCRFVDTTEDSIPHIIGPYTRDPVDCVCHGCSPGLAYWEYIVYVCAGTVFPIALLSVLYTIVKKCCKCFQTRGCNMSACCSKRICCVAGCEYDCMCGCKKLLTRGNNDYRATASNPCSIAVDEAYSTSLDRRVSIEVDESEVQSSQTTLIAHPESDSEEYDLSDFDQEHSGELTPYEQETLECEENTTLAAEEDPPCADIECLNCISCSLETSSREQIRLRDVPSEQYVYQNSTVRPFVVQRSYSVLASSCCSESSHTSSLDSIVANFNSNPGRTGNLSPFVGTSCLEDMTQENECDSYDQYNMYKTSPNHHNHCALSV